MTKTADSKYTFYTKAAYYHDLQNRIHATKAGERIALATMALDPADADVRQILHALGDAAERGVNVSFTVDAYIFLNRHKHGPGPLFFHSELPKRLGKSFRIRREVIEQLAQRGVHCRITNLPGKAFSNPVAGRSHIKFAIINDRLYIGGCNLDTVQNIDLMVAIQNHAAADWLYDFALKLVEHGNTSFLQGQDITHAINSEVEIFIDAGVRRQSHILQRALELIDNARKELLMVCQFFPNDVTADHLVAAYRHGIPVTVLYNLARKHDVPYNVIHYIASTKERMRLPASLFANRLSDKNMFTHAKLIASEQAAIIGSHNFVAAGVNFGTAEVALCVQTADFSKQAKTALLQQLHV